jgi:hypothetical protein
MENQIPANGMSLFIMNGCGAQKLDVAGSLAIHEQKKVACGPAKNKIMVETKICSRCKAVF